MIITGSLYITDSTDMIYKQMIQSVHRQQRCMVLDLDETGDELTSSFPQDVNKGTILLPPPGAIFLQIDGDQEGFLTEYYAHLQSQDVIDFIATVIFMTYAGINTLIYIPSYNEDSVWLNVLLQFFESEFGIHIGTGPTDYFRYDGMHDAYLINLMYLNRCIDVITYMREIPPVYDAHPNYLAARIVNDLRPFSGDEHPWNTYIRMVTALHTNPMVRPALYFDS